MATALICCPEPRRTQEFAHNDALSAFSSLATEQPQINLLAIWVLDEDAPFSEQPPAKRVQRVLCNVYNFEARFTKQTKPANDVTPMIARLALRIGYAAISQITSASYEQSRGGHGNHSGRRNSGGAGQSAPGSTVPLGAGNSGGGSGKHPMKRGGDGDGEGNPNKKKKVSNKPQGSFRCIIPELRQKSPEGDCAKPFDSVEAVVNHHLRKHVGHIQCPKCFIRKGTTTDMNKHKQPCTPPPTKIRKEIEIHGRNIRDVKSLDELKRLVAPNGEIQYDMANNIDNLAQSSVDDDDDDHVGQPAAPPQRQIDPVLVPGKKYLETGEILGPEIRITNHPCAPERTHKIPTPGSPLFVDTSRPGQVDMPTLGDIMGYAVSGTHHSDNSFGYPPIASAGINYDSSTLFDRPGTVDPRCLTKSYLDSGYSDLKDSSSQPGTEFSHYQRSEIWGEASTGGGGAVQAISGNEAPEQDPSSKLLERVNRVIEAFLECDNYPMGRQMAQLCAQNIAIQVPESILRVFAEAYQNKVGLKRETQAHNPTRGTKGKERERG